MSATRKLASFVAQTAMATIPPEVMFRALAGPVLNASAETLLERLRLPQAISLRVWFACPRLRIPAP